MKYHTLFFRKFGKTLYNLSSAAVVIGALRVKKKKKKKKKKKAITLVIFSEFLLMLTK